MNYLFHLLTLISIYLLLSLSLNILVGYTGLLSMCHAAFFGVGAYISGILTLKFGLNFVGAFALATLGTAVVSLLVSLPSVRLKGDYFVLSTFAFQIIIFEVLYNWTSLTGGPYGLRGIPSPSLMGHLIDTPAKYFPFSAVVSGLSIFLIIVLLKAPFGRVLKAVREDEIAAQSLGKNVSLIKVKSFALSAAFAGLAGALLAHYITYISATSFTLEESIFILSIVLVGGAGNLRGPVVGTVLLLLIPEVLMFLGMPDTVAPNVRRMIYGVLLVCFVFFRPQGIAGEYRFEKA
jgi:branched-chain amino acid transport system permease protein